MGLAATVDTGDHLGDAHMGHGSVSPMRVVTGSARGRTILAPPGTAVRPTTDRVREAIFNALGSLGLVEEAVVVDLFAGSGALGIEALSRGASRATFVDIDRRALEIVQANLDRCLFGDVGRVVYSDALVALGSGVAADADLVLADPPYRFDGWDGLFAAVTSPWLVAESDRAVVVGPNWEAVRTKAYGSTVVTVARRV